MDSLSPYDGLIIHVLEKFPERDILSITTLMQDLYADYNPEKQKLERDGLLLSRLDDIDEKYPKKYIDQILYGLDAHKYLEEVKLAGYIENEDDGGVDWIAEENSLVENSVFYAKSAFNIVKSLYRIHKRSKELKIHLLSIYVGYKKAEKLLKDSAIDRIPSAKDIVASECYFMSSEGYIGRRITIDDNKRQTLVEAIKIVTRRAADPVIEDLDTLYRSCIEVKGLNLLRENMKMYNEDIIEELINHYLEFRRDIKINNKIAEVKESLSTISIDEYVSKATSNVVDVEFMIRNAKKLFKHTVALNNDMSIDRTEDILLCLGKLGKKLNQTALKFRSGFLHYNNEMEVLVDVSSVCTEPLLHKMALVHRSGFLFIVSDTNILYYKRIDDIMAYISAVEYKQELTAQFHNNELFGSWNKVSLC
ncbi:MAG: hypothetical protein LBS29_04990 [Endomicrobium sp.]|jgi:hypothetical protein|nr:hypothetical protein [Endomicrobium sp.]